MACEVDRCQRGEPSSLVGREDAERRPSLRRHLVALADHLVLRRQERDASLRERLLDRSVAIERRRLVVAVGVDRFHAQRIGERGDFAARESVANDQPAASRTQCGVELAHAFQDELDAPVAARRQRIEDVAIEDERRMNWTAVRKRAGKCRVIEVAKVASKPDQAACAVPKRCRAASAAPGDVCHA